MDILEYIKKQYSEPIRLMADRVVLGEFFSSIKPINESFNLTIEAMKKLAEGVHSETEIMPLFVQKKYRGIGCQIHKNAESIVIYSEDGKDITSRLPSIVKEARSLKEGRLILNAILEMWENGVCQSKEKLSDYLYGGQKVDDKTLMASCFDCLWSNDKDLHKLTFKDRFRELSNIALVQSTVGEPNFSQGHLNSAPTSFVQTESELKKALVYFTRADPLKGAIVRFAEMDYPLNGLHTQIMKMKNYSVIQEGVNWAIQVKKKFISENFSIKNRKKVFQSIIENSLKEFPLTEAEFEKAIKYFEKNNMLISKRIMESIKKAKYKKN